MKNNVTTWLAIGFAATFTLFGCKKDDPQPSDNASTPGAYQSGVFITNEGPFGSGTGTVSFLNRTTGTISNDIFQNANGIPLGNIVQSMSIHNGKAYVVVNNSGKVEVANADDFKSTGTITGLNMPRYFLGIDNTKGFISEWGPSGSEGYIKVVDLTTNAITSTITTGMGADQMLKINSSVYVACKGGFGTDSTITVINSTSNSIAANIKVGAAPNSMQIDANGKIWVLCGGQWNSSFTALDKTGKLMRINPLTNMVELTIDFSSTSSTPTNLTINKAKNQLYFSYQGAVMKQDISSVTLNATNIINRNFYALGVDPNSDYIYAGDAGNFSSNGYLIRYNTNYTKIDSFQVGIIPGGFCFR